MRTLVQHNHRVTLSWTADGPVTVLRNDDQRWGTFVVIDGSSDVDDVRTRPPAIFAYGVCLVSALSVWSVVVTP